MRKQRTLHYGLVFECIFVKIKLNCKCVYYQKIIQINSYTNMIDMMKITYRRHCFDFDVELFRKSTEVKSQKMSKTKYSGNAIDTPCICNKKDII